MQRIKIMGLALVAVLAMSALVASTAFAKESKDLIIKDPSGVVPTGTLITATSTNLTTVTAAGNLECEHNVLPSTLSINSAVKDKSSSSSESSFGDYLGIEGACKTSAAGPAIINTSEFPWPVEFSDKGTATVKGTKKVAFTSTFLALEGPKNKCTFEAAKIVSTFAVGKAGSPVPVEFTTTNQIFKLNKKAPDTAAICPPEGKLSGNWAVTDSNGQISDEL
jgi:hypothetical protein